MGLKGGRKKVNTQLWEPRKNYPETFTSYRLFDIAWCSFTGEEP